MGVEHRTWRGWEKFFADRSTRALPALEVVGVRYYHLLAAHLPPSRLREQLLEIVEDVRSHLYFHCDFLRVQTPTVWRNRLFVGIWRLLMVSVSVVVLLDHRHAIRAD